ncbi:MAG: hypothetical protein FD138_3472 [Planctomycetota bacterium]|nr:MAG: hypothetical protein FD138_3472 [Planctomycetota bacterium]
MTFSLSLNGASDSSDDPNSMSRPSPFDHQCGGEMPSPMNKHANRCGVFRFSAATVSAPNTETDSNHGNATDAPKLLSNRRREMAT